MVDRSYFNYVSTIISLLVEPLISHFFMYSRISLSLKLLCNGMSGLSLLFMALNCTALYNLTHAYKKGRSYFNDLSTIIS